MYVVKSHFGRKLIETVLFNFLMRSIRGLAVTFVVAFLSHSQSYDDVDDAGVLTMSFQLCHLQRQ